MRSSFRFRLACGSCLSLLVASGFGCSGSEPSIETAGSSGTAGHSGSAPSVAGAPSIGAAGSATGGIAGSGGAGAATAGTTAGGSATNNAGSGGHSSAGAAGISGGGAHAGAAAGGSAGTTSAGSGGTSSAAVCDLVKTEYAAELAKQLECKPGAGSQCANRAAAAPGCECRVFIQPSDPFAIEHLSNVANGWFDADCVDPTCPAKCSTAAAGTCQADAKSSLGGRCVSP
ncbi:MAG TPA: hypothetical protein VHP33_16930 [Polyangiaceae bacterium]|nr:hypothetical protein [Polyangiaceae bacterium]